MGNLPELAVADKAEVAAKVRKLFEDLGVVPEEEVREEISSVLRCLPSFGRFQLSDLDDRKDYSLFGALSEVKNLNTKADVSALANVKGIPASIKKIQHELREIRVCIEASMPKGRAFLGPVETRAYSKSERFLKRTKIYQSRVSDFMRYIEGELTKETGPARTVTRVTAGDVERCFDLLAWSLERVPKTGTLRLKGREGYDVGRNRASDFPLSPYRFAVLLSMAMGVEGLKDDTLKKAYNRLIKASARDTTAVLNKWKSSLEKRKKRVL